ncbi:MAG: DUF2977 domain-containing protein [Acutalibacteraceae bacterium]|nr:DUF2977 domain-containing protein [Acutalibacteraceae bacterium]
MRQIIVDDNNAVIGYCEGDGYVDDGIDVEYYPDNFVEEFAPEKWLYVDGEYMLNPDYVEPTDEPTSDDPTSEEILNVLLGVDE